MASSPRFAAVVLVSLIAVAAFALTPILARFGADSLPEFRYRAWPLIWARVPPPPALRIRVSAPSTGSSGPSSRSTSSSPPISTTPTTTISNSGSRPAGWAPIGDRRPRRLVRPARLAGVVAAQGSSLARAASLGVLVLAAMSWVDYPLRTESLAVLLRFLLAAMASERRRARPDERGAAGHLRDPDLREPGTRLEPAWPRCRPRRARPARDHRQRRLPRRRASATMSPAARGPPTSRARGPATRWTTGTTASRAPTPPFGSWSIRTRPWPTRSICGTRPSPSRRPASAPAIGRGPGHGRDARFPPRPCRARSAGGCRARAGAAADQLDRPHRRLRLPRRSPLRSRPCPARRRRVLPAGAEDRAACGAAGRAGRLARLSRRPDHRDHRSGGPRPRRTGPARAADSPGDRPGHPRGGDVSPSRARRWSR